MFDRMRGFRMHMPYFKNSAPFSDHQLNRLRIKLEKELKTEINASISCSLFMDSVRLVGTVDSWQEAVKAGQIAANSKFREVINDIFFEGNKQKIPKNIHLDDNARCEYWDFAIIGGGIIGCSIARELSKYNVKVCIIEKEYDVAIHASSRNDGMIHPGIAAPIGSLKSKMNMRGNVLYERISKELEVPINWCGSSILFKTTASKIIWPFFWIKAKLIGLKGLEYMDKKSVYRQEPHLSEGVKWGVLCKRAGVTSPYKMTVAYAENAIENGAVLKLNTMVMGIKSINSTDPNPTKPNEIVAIYVQDQTEKYTIKSKIVINAAGVYSDFIAELAGDRFFSIHPRKGEVVLFDKKKANLVNGILGFMGDRSSKHTKGGGIIRTYEGNILVGPNAIETFERDNYETNRVTIDEMLKLKLPQIKGLELKDDITFFTGIRASTYKEDFIIEPSRQLNNLIHVAGIQSPGFASAPAISEYVETICHRMYQDLTKEKMKPNENFNPIRKAIPNFQELSLEERNKRIALRPEYGEIICRCEEISKGEILDALHTPIKVDTVDGVKRRVRAGMGRCQGGFCMPLVMEIIHSERDIPMDQITKKSGKSKIAVHFTKD
ncbi:FAD-dependent oxidoreductase [Fusibacter bizertensis]